MLDHIDRTLRKLPASTADWTCQWFLTILYVSIFLFAIGLTVIPGTFGVIATHTAVASAAYTLGQRR